MPAMLRDQYLEKLIEQEQKRRGDTNLAKTLRDLVRERLTQLEYDRKNNQQNAR